MKGEHFWLVLIRFKLDLHFQFPVIVFFVCIFKEGRCNDVTIASTSLRSTKRTDNLDACTRVMLCIFCNSQLTVILKSLCYLTTLQPHVLLKLWTQM